MCLATAASLISNASAMHAGYRPAATASAVSVWAVSHIDGGTALDDVACPSRRLCVAVDESGRVSCPSRSLCVAIDGDGNVVSSTDPTGGTRAWHRTEVDTNPLTDVSCPSISLCVAVDENADYADNAESSNVLTSTDPARGGSWRVTFDDRSGFTEAESGGLDAVSCPSRTFCVAADTAGNVLTSNHPTRGGSWTVRPLGDALDAVTCLSESMCAGVDGDGNLLTTRHPAAGPTA